MEFKDRNLQEEEIISLAMLIHEYEMSLIPENEKLQEQYQLSELFYHNMDNIIRKRQRKFHNKNLRRRCAAVAAVALVILGIAQSQLIARGAEWLVHWFKDHVSFQLEKNTDINRVSRYKFGYVPEGFEQIIDDYYDISGYIMYENEYGNRFDLAYGEIGGSLNIDNENKDFTILTGTHGEEIYFLRAQNPDDDSSMTWISKDGTTIFNLMGDLPEDELLKLQENICPVEHE